MEAQVEADLQAALELVRESDPSDSDLGSAVLSTPPLASSQRKPGHKKGMKRGRVRRTSGRGNSEKVLGEEEDKVEQHGHADMLDELEQLGTLPHMHFEHCLIC